MPDSLEHLQVVELGGGLRASYAAKCLADLGADVVKLERPDGDIVRKWPPFIGDQPGPTRSGLFAYCNTNKRSVVVDYEQHEGQAVALALAAETDILIEGLAPGQLGELGRRRIRHSSGRRHSRMKPQPRRKEWVNGSANPG